MPKSKTSPKLKINLQIIHKAEYIPKASQFKTWAKAALANRRAEPSEIDIRIVDEEESATLNQKYRNKSGPTNILSFPFEAPSSLPIELELELPMLGDLVICAPLVLKEALAQKKTIEAHFAHLTVHGVLHLLGYDHEVEKEAQIMEDLEDEIMEILGYEF